MYENWISAAERYARYNRKFELSPEQINDLIEFTAQLRTFLMSKEGVIGCVLLAAADKFITLAVVEPIGDAKAPEMLKQLIGPAVYGWGQFGPTRIRRGPFGAGQLQAQAPFQEFAYVMLQKGRSFEGTIAFIRDELDRLVLDAPMPE